ncbi:biotin/lipoyl-binding protein [Campylobacter pinnipediorum]|uniref:biotin/lipoyl-binding protein n=1 Tax=Campylobacter pinnipediorum TaxID=1965231 RepID=UPI00214D0C5E|nr:biotin/lipoyl-binding protein [Campylobacter pinnipediorum]
MLKIFKDIKDDSYEFKPTIVEIEETPLNPIGRSILWIVIAIIVFGVFWLFFAKVDIVVSASGKYIPSGNIKILKPLESGIISQILVKEGDKVKAKDPLIVIDPSVSTVNLTTKEENLKALKYSIKRLELLANEDEFIKNVNLSIDEKSLYINQKTNYDETISQYIFKIEQLINSIKENKEEIKKLTLLKDITTKRIKKLNRVKEIIAYKEYEDTKSKELDLKSQLIVSNEKLLMEKARLNQIKTELDVFKSSSKTKWMDELLNKQKEASLVRAEINALTFQTKQQIISSPVDGYVGKLLVHTIGLSIRAFVYSAIK